MRLKHHGDVNFNVYFRLSSKSKNFLQGNVRDRRVDTGEDKDGASERERRKHRHLAEEKYSRQMEVSVMTMASEKEVSH